MHRLVRRLVAAVALATATVTVLANEPGVPFQPFLDCAASRAYYRYLVEVSGTGNADELKELDKYVQYYLQIAESLSQRSLRKEFLESSDSEKQKATKIMQEGGSDAYFAYYAERKNECGRMVREHQKEIMDAADRLYQGREKH